MPARERDDRGKARDKAELQPRWDNAFHWSRHASVYLGLPALRAYYPLGAVGTAGQALDLSGLGNHLTLNGDPVFDYENLIQLVDYDGTGDYHDITDGASANAFDIRGNETYIPVARRGLTVGCWVRFDGVGSLNYIVSKWDVGGVNQAYRLIRVAANRIRASITIDGTTVVTATNTAPIVASTWYHIVLRFRANNDLVVFVNGVAGTAVAAPVTIFNSSANFTVGAQSTGLNELNGQESDVFVCAIALSNAQIGSIFEQPRAMFGVR